LSRTLIAAVYSSFNLPVAGEPNYRHTTNVLGALNGANSGGAFVGSVISAWAADKFGRKVAIIIGCVSMIIGGRLNAGSVSISMFIVGRVFAGIGAGILAIVTPMYQGEVATAETRGAMMFVTGIMYTWGYSIAGWLGYACVHIIETSRNASAAW
jgi:MFS family permease